MFNLMSFTPTNFGRYASQTEHAIDDLINTTDRVQQKSSIPPLMSLSITPPPPETITTTNTQLNSSLPLTSVTKENIEPLPFPQHGPGPIQRPNKLSCPLNIQQRSFLNDTPQSPDTPEVLVQINHLVDRQNSIATNASTMINDISTPGTSWTPFTPTDWSIKYETSWPLPTIQTPNPFIQRQISKDETNLWTDVPANASWLKFSPALPLNRQENETNNSFWNPSETSAASWWPKTPSDENNNNQSRWEFAR